MYKTSFPMREYVTSYKNRKPWLTEGIKYGIKRKNELWVKSKRHLSMHFAPQYNGYKKYLLKYAEKHKRIITTIFSVKIKVTS